MGLLQIFFLPKIAKARHGQASVEAMVVLSVLLCISVGLGAMFHAAQKGTFVQKAADAQSHRQNLQTGIKDIVLY